MEVSKPVLKLVETVAEAVNSAQISQNSQNSQNLKRSRTPETAEASGEIVSGTLGNVRGLEGLREVSVLEEQSDGTELLQEVLNLTDLPDECCDALHTDLHDALVDAGVAPEVASLDDLRQILLQYLEETNAEMNRELALEEASRTSEL